MLEMFPLTRSQYTVIVSALLSTDFKNSKRFNTLTLCFEWTEASEELLNQIGNWLLEKNDSFRLKPVYKFPWRWSQFIEPYKEEKFPVVYFKSEEEYEAWLEKEKNNDIRLLKDKLYSFKILVRPGSMYTLWIQMHHFLTDGYSMKLMANQVRALNLYFTKEEPLLFPQPPSYRDYVEKEKTYYKSEQFKLDRAYWKEVFRYQRDYSFPAGSRSMNMESASQSITIDKVLYNKLSLFCRENKLSVSTVLASSAAAVSYTIKGATYFSMATLSYGRHDGVSRNTVGCMMNSPVMMYRIKEEESFIDFLMKNHNDNLEMLRHVRFSYIDFAPLSFLLCTLRGMNYNHSWIILSHMDYESVFKDGEPKGRMFWSNTLNGQMYVAIFDLPKEEKIIIELRYQIKLFKEDRIKGLLAAYVNTLEVALNEPNKLLKEFPKISLED